MVALNSGAALYVMDQVSNLREGVELARETLRTGKALATLDALVAVSRSASQGID
jgi:anthranilate phosphoribosyltransferase